MVLAPGQDCQEKQAAARRAYEARRYAEAAEYFSVATRTCGPSAPLFLALGQAQARIGSGVLGRIARLPWQPLGSISFATLAALYRGALKLLEALDHPKSIGYDLRLQQIRGAAMESQEDLKR